MRKITTSIVNASAVPRGVVIPEKCLVNSFILKYHAGFLVDLLDACIDISIVDDIDDETYIVMTLNLRQFEFIKSTDTRLGTLFKGMTW